MSTSSDGAICTRQYEINSFLVNSQGRLGLYAFLNLLQDVGWVHATQLGHGHENTLSRQAIWVLTRQSIALVEWPPWGSHLTLQTWLRPPTGLAAIRDYAIYFGDKKIGDATSSFLLLNAETRKPIREGISKLEFKVRTEARAPFDAETVRAAAHQTGLETLSKFKVRNSDIDSNKHVNNTRYAQWILDALPMESQSRFRLGRYDVNFLAETKLGDFISIQRAGLESSAEHGVTYFQGYRESDSKVVFTALLHVDATSV